MSFFGLTSFGPECIIQSSLVNCNGFSLFFDDDYKRAFIELYNEELLQNRDQQGIKISSIAELLKRVFGFKPLEDEVKILKQFINKSDDEELLWDELLSSLNKVRGMLYYLILEFLNNKAKTSVKFKSYQHYYDERYKHIRKDVQPNETFKQPVSSGQVYGFYKFYERNLNNVSYPKNKCEETKYADAIVKSGKEFMK